MSRDHRKAEVTHGTVRLLGMGSFFAVQPGTYAISSGSTGQSTLHRSRACCSFGAPRAARWIADLMRFHGVPYYVGLLSAAALHGASHQQSQEFQVVVGAVLRPLTVGRVRLSF